jgi:biotin carboxyl carrier protein
LEANARAAPADVTADGVILAFADGEAFAFADPTPDLGASEAGNGQLTAPMPGRIVQVAGKLGNAVVKGEPLVTLEAMKMEHTLTAPFDGEVVELSVRVGDQVSEGKILARVAASVVAPAS